MSEESNFRPEYVAFVADGFFGQDYLENGGDEVDQRNREEYLVSLTRRLEEVIDPEENSVLDYALERVNGYETNQNPNQSTNQFEGIV